MNSFPKHPIDLHKMFKKTKLYVLHPEIENRWIIKMHVSKVKSKQDLENAFLKVEKCANEFGFQLSLEQTTTNFSDFRFHGGYYEIWFSVK